MDATIYGKLVSISLKSLIARSVVFPISGRAKISKIVLISDACPF